MSINELENDEVIRQLLNITMDGSNYLLSLPLVEFKAKHYPVLVRLQKLYNEGEQ
jgi:hypothetical protein